MKTLQHVLVPIDLSKTSALLLKHAARMATWNDAAIHVLHVVPNGGDRRAAGAAVAKCLADAGLAEGAVATIIEEGRPVEHILKTIERLGIDLLLMNAHDKGKKHLGPVAAHAVRRAPCRVLLVRDWQGEPFRKLGVCLDFTGLSERVFRQALRVALCDGASLELIHVIYPTRLDYKVYQADFGKKSEAEFREGVLVAVQSDIDKFLDPFRPDLGEVTLRSTILESEAAAAAITGHVQAGGHDLVVIGTTGRTRAFGLHFGSNAEELVRDTPCSVLAIKPMDE